MRTCKRLSLVFVLACLGSMFVVTGAWAQGVDNNNVFELDGNTQDDALAGEDWETPPTGGTTIPIQDPAPQSIYTQGGSKDTNDVSMWMCKDGSVPDKDNILQAGAVPRTLPNGDLAIYFFATRRANNGDAQLGLWWLQAEGACMPDGTFGAGVTHIDGDLLVLVNFEGGGLVPSIEVYKWQGGVGGMPVLATGLTTGECGFGADAGNYDVCAITNAAPSLAPASWGYEPKFGVAGTFPAQSFFEGGINLNSVFGSDLPCFTSFITETRSSSSITAQLKDLVGGQFLLCKLGVTKACSDGSVILGGTQIQYTASGTVTNDGPGPLYDIIVEDDPGVCADDFTVNVDLSTQPTAGQLASGDSAGWSGTFTSSELSCLNTAVAKAKPSATATTRTVISDPASDPCTTSVSNDVSVSKACDPGTSLFDAGSEVVVQVGVKGQVCNEGDSQLTGVTLVHDPSATVTLSTSTLAPKGEAGECANWSVSYFPEDISSGDGTVPGRYYFDDEIRVTAASATLGNDPGAAAGCTNASDLACATASCPICPEGACPVPPE